MERLTMTGTGGAWHGRDRPTNPGDDEAPNGTTSLDKALARKRDQTSQLRRRIDEARDEGFTIRSVFALFISLTFALAIQLFGCMPPTRTAYAQQTSHTITAQGQGVPAQGTYSDGSTHDTTIQAGFVDEEGTSGYWCIEPNKIFTAGTFHVATPKSLKLTQPTILRCALAQEWCATHVDADKAGACTQIFIWRILEEQGAFVEHEAEDTVAWRWRQDSFDTDALFEQFLTWCAENGSGLRATATCWSRGEVSQAVATFTLLRPAPQGALRVHKVAEGTTDATLTTAGAIYGVWSDQQCTVSAGADLVTGSDGFSEALALDEGTYYLKEKQAPSGFELDDSVHIAQVTSSETCTVVVSDRPCGSRVSVWARKADADGCERGQGTASLAGAELFVRYFRKEVSADALPATPDASWIVFSDDTGAFCATGDTLPVLTGGTLAFQETLPPSGYWTEGQDESSAGSYTSPITIVPVDATGAFTPPTITDRVKRAGLTAHKIDAETPSHAPQGASTLAGITFEVVSTNERPVVVEGTAYARGEVVWTMETDESGDASTKPNLLPVGTYVIREQAANESLVRTDEVLEVTIHPDDAGKMVDAGALANRVARGGVQLRKVSRETQLGRPQGASSLAGAEFAITLESDQPVVVNGATIAPHEVVQLIRTDDEGLACTSGDLLPFGIYSIREVGAPEGYLIDDVWEPRFAITHEGEVADLVTDDQVIRGGLTFRKVDADSRAPLAGIPFLITSLTTGESHLIASDADGVVSTERVAHTTNTNECDRALLADYSVADFLLTTEAGIWFSGDPEPTLARDEDMALPYDTYRVQELPCEANASMEQLATFDLEIREHRVLVDRHEVDNRTLALPEISTTLYYQGQSGCALASESCVLTDVVHYLNLELGATYELRGQVVSLDEGGKVREVVSVAQTSFVSGATAGTCEQTFSFNATTVEESTLVATEELYRDGNFVCKHYDLLDPSQTIRLPHLSTSLTTTDGGKFVTGGDEATLTDTVSYEGLVPGQTYELCGTLVDRDTAAPLATSEGTALRAQTTFVADASTGSCEVPFTVATADVLGSTIVACEELRHAGVVVATHADLADENQTVRAPQLLTELTDTASNHIVFPSDTVTLNDTVTYAGLVPNQTYELHGVLVDKATSEPLATKTGTVVEATCTFTPTEAGGSAVVSFTAPGDVLSGKTVVAQETLSLNDVIVCSHANLEDEAQTVWCPQITTELRDASNQHSTEPSSTTKLTDTIFCQSLRPHTTYTVVGSLVDQKSGTEIVDAQGKPIVAQTSFTPEGTDDTVRVSFAFDTTSLQGTSVVAYESVREETADGREVTRHADIDEPLQTVAVLGAQGEKTSSSSTSAALPLSVTPATSTSKSSSTLPATTATTATTTGGSTPTATTTTTTQSTPTTGDEQSWPVAIVVCGIVLIVLSRMLRR